MTPHDQAELTRALFEESGDALFLLDPDTDRLLDVNPVALRFTGLTRAELLQSHATQLFRIEPGGGPSRLREAFSNTVVFHAQDGYLLRTRDGAGWFPVSLTVSRLHVAPRTLGLIVARDDRERRAALAHVRRVEAELRTVLNNSPAALWSAERPPGPDVFAGWQYRYVSALLGKIAGRPPEFFDTPSRWADAVHPADRDAYRAGVRRLLTGTAADAEQVYRVLAADGAVRWVRDRLQAVRDEAGRPVRLDGSVADITAQWQAEEAVRQSERRFRALVEKSRDGLLLIDDRGAVRYASPAAKAVLGCDPAALVGKPALSIVHPADLTGAREKMAFALSRPGEDVPGRFRVVAANGAVRHLEANCSNRLDDPSVRAVVMHYRDVTDRDAAVRELKREHALLEGMFASVPDVVCYKDRELRLLGGNPAFEALAGRPLAELLGKTCRDVFPDPWAAGLRAVQPGVIASGQAVRAREWVNYPTGRRALLDISMAPLRADDGAIIGLILVGRDVTERERLEGALRESLKMEAVGRLAGGVAHDFNNLLTVVLGNLELLRAGVAPADAEELLAGAERAGRQAADLTRQMLGFARRRPVRATVVDLNALVRDALGLLRRTIDPRVAVDFQPAAGLRPVAVDPVQVQQVVMNLCLNARDAMPDGGTLTIETSAADALPGADPDDTPTADCFIRLSVSDTGVGMSDEVRARVFEPFFTTKDVGQGTGLGLAVVYGVARAHGGTVTCASEPGLGSRFDVYLPCGSVADLPVEAAPASPPAERGHGETVLVADDEPGVRNLARAGLELHGYRVLTAEDGAAAVDVFRREGPGVGLVLLDAMMPNMTGREAFDVIRGIDPRVPVLFASGYPASETIPTPPPARTGFLHKPYTPTQLAAEVRRLLNESGTG